MAEDVAMAPAYGGMFRPPPKRRVGCIIAGVVGALVLLVAAAISVLWLKRQHDHFAETGQPCLSGCAHGKCVHETNGDSYCAGECSSDRDCPSAFVCDPTLSGRHHVCLKAGAETGGLSHRRGR